MNEWKYYSPPNSGFRVKLPKPIKEVKYFDAEHGVDGSDSKPDIQSYVETHLDSKSVRFGIVVLKPRFVKKLMKEMTTFGLSKEEIKDHLAVIYFGDDDESQLLSKPRMIDVKGVRANEYVFLNDDVANRGYRPLYSRGRIYEDRGKFFLLIFVGSNPKDLYSSDPNEFFNSFEVISTKKK